jgi:hypothetical protein
MPALSTTRPLVLVCLLTNELLNSFIFLLAMVPFIFGLYHQVIKVTLIHNPDAGDDQSPSGDELIEFIQHEEYTVGYQSSKDENSLSRPARASR